MTTDRDPAVAHGLVWTIKSQFLRYIAGMADGRCSVTDGAEVVAVPAYAGGHQIDRGRDGVLERFHFEFAGASTEAATTTLHFRGEVRFSGHHGFLFVRIADPALTVDQALNGVMTIACPDPTDTAAPRLRFARLHMSGSARGSRAPICAETAKWTGSDVRLTAEGAELFGGAYAESEPFDDLRVTIPFSAAQLFVRAP